MTEPLDGDEKQEAEPPAHGRGDGMPTRHRLTLALLGVAGSAVIALLGAELERGRAWARLNYLELHEVKP